MACCVGRLGPGVSIRTKFIFAVVKYQRLRGASPNQAFSKTDQWL